MSTSRILLGAMVCVTLLGCRTSEMSAGREQPSPVAAVAQPVSVTPTADTSAVNVEANPVGIFATRTTYHNDRLAMAFDGTNYVAAWADSRTTADNVYIARLRGSDGTLLDPTGVLLSDLTAPPLSLGLFQNTPTRTNVMNAVGGGATYVSWMEYAENVFQRMIVVRLDSSGKVLARHSIEAVATSFLDLSGNTGYLPGVAGLKADGSGVAAFYYARNPNGGYDIVARRIASDTMSGPITIVARRTSFGGDVTVGMAEGALLASCYGDFTTLEDGPQNGAFYAVVPAGSTALPVVRKSPFVNSGTSDVFGVAGEFRLFVRTDQVLVAKIDGTGKVLSTAALPRSWMSVAPTTVEDQFVVRANDPVCLQTIDGNAVPIGACVPLVDDADFPSSHFGEGSLVAGTDTVASLYVSGGKGGTEFDPYLLNVSILNRATAGGVAKKQLSSSANRQMFSNIATDGQTYVATWREDRTSAAQSGSLGAVFAARLDADGRMTGAPIQLSSGPSNFAGPLGGNAPSPQVLFDGTKYIVAWGQGEGGGGDESDRLLSVRAAILPSDGPLVVEKPIVIPSSFGMGDVALANDGINTILAFTRGNGLYFEIGVARISNAEHKLLDPEPQTISSSSGYRFAPSLAFDGTRTLVAWIDQQATSLVVLGALIEAGENRSKAGTFPIYNSGRFALQPAVASDKKHGFFVVWSEISTEDFQQNLFGKLVGSDGSLGAPGPDGKRNDRVADAMPLSVFGHDQRNHRAVYANDGSNYFVTWSDGRRAPDYDVRGTWVDVVSGKVHDPEGFAVAAQTGVFESTPSVVFRTTTEALVVYQEYSSDPAQGAFRLKARKLSASALLGNACQVDDDCASRSCADGVCCSTSCNDGCGVCNLTPGTCTPKAVGTTCGPSSSYRCDGATMACTLHCESSVECAVGSYCVTGQCEPVAARCADENTAEPMPGNLIACAPFKCRGNACLAGCGSVDDCAAGLLCDFEGKCVAPPGPPENEEPSCAMGRPAQGESSSRSVSFFGIAAVAVLGAARVRRRRKTRAVGSKRGAA